jgi:uncharacterized protein (DUF2062 family)
MTPRKSWRRGFEYIGRRVQRLPDSPHRIALGFACGVLASFTPLFTLHFVVAMGIAWVLRSNLIAAALGTAFGNPLTFPFIAGVSLELGGWMLGVEKGLDGFNPGMAFTDFSRFMDRIFLPYLVGGVLPGLLCAVVCYVLLRPLVAAYQSRRRQKLTAAAALRMARRPTRGHAPPRRPQDDAPEGGPGRGGERRAARDPALSAAAPCMTEARP